MMETFVFSFVMMIVPGLHREVKEISTRMTTNDSTLRHDKSLTPIAKDDLLDVLRQGHMTVFGRPPTKPRLAASWAQVAFENGQGKKVWNYNLGNVASPPRIRMQEFYCHVGQMPKCTPYRSFKTFHEGAIAYWKVLKRCSAALSAFDSGDMDNAAVYLKSCGYYTTDVEHYSTNLRSLYYTALSTVMKDE